MSSSTESADVPIVAETETAPAAVESIEGQPPLDATSPAPPALPEGVASIEDALARVAELTEDQVRQVLPLLTPRQAVDAWARARLHESLFIEHWTHVAHATFFRNAPPNAEPSPMPLVFALLFNAEESLAVFSPLRALLQKATLREFHAFIEHVMLLLMTELEMPEDDTHHQTLDAVDRRLQRVFVITRDADRFLAEGLLPRWPTLSARPDSIRSALASGSPECIDWVLSRLAKDAVFAELRHPTLWATPTLGSLLHILRHLSNVPALDRMTYVALPIYTDVCATFFDTVLPPMLQTVCPDGAPLPEHLVNLLQVVMVLLQCATRVARCIVRVRRMDLLTQVVPRPAAILSVLNLIKDNLFPGVPRMYLTLLTELTATENGVAALKSVLTLAHIAQAQLLESPVMADNATVEPQLTRFLVSHSTDLGGVCELIMGEFRVLAERSIHEVFPVSALLLSMRFCRMYIANLSGRADVASSALALVPAGSDAPPSGQPDSENDSPARSPVEQLMRSCFTLPCIGSAWRREKMTPTSEALARAWVCAEAFVAHPTPDTAEDAIKMDHGFSFALVPAVILRTLWLCNLPTQDCISLMDICFRSLGYNDGRDQSALTLALMNAGRIHNDKSFSDDDFGTSLKNMCTLAAAHGLDPLVSEFGIRMPPSLMQRVIDSLNALGDDPCILQPLAEGASAAADAGAADTHCSLSASALFLALGTSSPFNRFVSLATAYSLEDYRAALEGCWGPDSMSWPAIAHHALSVIVNPGNAQLFPKLCSLGFRLSTSAVWTVPWPAFSNLRKLWKQERVHVETSDVLENLIAHQEDVWNRLCAPVVSIAAEKLDFDSKLDIIQYAPSRAVGGNPMYTRFDASESSFRPWVPLVRCAILGCVATGHGVVEVIRSESYHSLSMRGILAVPPPDSKLDAMVGHPIEFTVLQKCPRANAPPVQPTLVITQPSIGALPVPLGSFVMTICKPGLYRGVFHPGIPDALWDIPTPASGIRSVRDAETTSGVREMDILHRDPTGALVHPAARLFEDMLVDDGEDDEDDSSIDLDLPSQPGRRDKTSNIKESDGDDDDGSQRVGDIELKDD